MPKKRGAPRFEFNQRIADRILEAIVDGKSLRSICELQSMPSRSTVLKWLEENPSFADRYAHAREAAADSFADYIVALAAAANENNYNSIRVKVDALKWIASKLKPKRYGDRLELQADVNLTAARSQEEKPLSEWRRAEKLDWMRRQVYLVALIGKELRDVWGLENLAEGYGLLGDETWKQVLAVIEGRHKPPAPPVGLLPAPPQPEAMQREEREINAPPEHDQAPEHYPSRHERGLE